MKLENKQLKEKAQQCRSCLDWLKICNSECCKEFNITKKNLKKHRLGLCMESTNISDDMKYYYHLHGAYILKDKLILPRGKYEMKEEGEVIYFIRPCNYLDKEGLCTGHARGIKPEICKDFDELTGKSGKKNAYATKNCLCRFRT